MTLTEKDTLKKHFKKGAERQKSPESGSSKTDALHIHLK